LKTIDKFGGLKHPVTVAEHELGICLLLLLSNVDPKMALSSNKKELLDKSWSTGIAKYLSNNSQVLKKIRSMSLFLEISYK